jgi:hypothetical protein
MRRTGRIRTERATGRAGTAARAAIVTGLAVAGSLHAGATGETWPVPRARVAPQIDGASDPIWGEVPAIQFGVDVYNISLRALHDDRTLYLLIRDPTDTTAVEGDRFSLTFEDEGGSLSHLWGGSWSHSICDEDGDSGEGRLDVEGLGELRTFFGYLLDGSVCAGTPVSRIEAVIRQDHPEGGGVTAEIAIPIDGPTALEAAGGYDFGSRFEVVDEIGGTPFLVGSWPESTVIHDFANATLATLGCNAGIEDFDPWIGADWERSHVAGTVDWILTGGGGCTVPNSTGGAGRAACLEHVTSDPAAAFLDSQAVSLAAAAAAELRFRANLEVEPGWAGLVVEASADGGASWSETLLDWSEDHGTPGGPGESVVLALPAALLGEPDVRFRFIFSAAPASPAAFAQLDDLHLTCGPGLFADGFESGLTTHWSATFPYP